MLFVEHFQHQYRQQKGLEEQLLVEDQLQQKIQNPERHVVISPWNAPVHVSYQKNKAKAWVTIHGKTYQHEIEFHPY